MNRATLAATYRREGHWRAETLPARLAAMRAARAGDPAISDAGRRMTFDEVAGAAERLAGHLAALGAGAGDVVSWQLPCWWEAVVVHHAALRLGALPNPLNPIFRAREMRFVLAEARPRVLVVPAAFRGYDHAALALRLRAEIPSLSHVVVARGTAPGALELDALLAEPPPAPAPDDPSAPALLLYTSGTTSNPKGVLHSHETLL